MSQRNKIAELGFTDIAGKARAMMVQANLTEEITYKLCKECFNYALYLSNLAVVTLNGKAATRYEYFYEANHVMPCGKVGNRGTPMIFVVYAKNHAVEYYCSCNPKTGYVTKTRDITWMHHTYYGKSKARDEVIAYLQVALLFELGDTEAREGVTLNAYEPKTKSKDDEKE